MTRLWKLSVVAIACGLLAAGCAAADSGTPSTTGPISGTWIEVHATGDIFEIPMTTIEEHTNIHFSIDGAGQTLDYMAYLLGDELHVRANVCPPCRSRGFTLDGTVLVCDMCATTFDARNGEGIEGACVDYPKAMVAHKVSDGSVRMSLADLVAAFEETEIPG